MENINLKLYKTMYLIRAAEEKIREHYMEDEMKTPVHLCIGEEAIAAGVCQALKTRDQIFGTYRAHGIYLAKGGDIDKFFAELYGRQSGLARGKTGSMHLSSPEVGFLGSSAVVATTIPVAAGAAYANKIKKNNKIVAVFFGDGAIDEGVFWETINFACLKKLPIIFVCEDNGLAIHTKDTERHGYKSIAKIISQFECNVIESKSTDAEIIKNLTLRAISLHRRNKKPSFMHLKYYRYYQHVGIDYDFDAGYRSYSEFKKWLRVDPISLQRDKLIKGKYSEEYVRKLEEKIEKQIKKSVEKARKSKFVNKKELYKNVICD